MKKYLPLFALLISYLGVAQDAIPFQEEVKDIVQRNDSLWDNSQETIIFTGSSSIRFWEDLQERFPKKQVLNSGFGGSQASDLLIHLDDLVLRYQPKLVFIYEGDNDIFNKKRPKQVLVDTAQIVEKLKEDREDRMIVLISAKPSLSRWKLKRKYKRLNKKLSNFAKKQDGVEFVDVWNPMLDGRRVMSDIFVEDGLHMNEKGYDIWYTTLKEYVK